MTFQTFEAYGSALYEQFARIGSALASGRRLLLLELLVQAPRHVDALAEETGMSVANASQHLQTLRAAGLVDPTREGNRVRYRIADDSVLALWDSLREVAERQLAEVERLRRQFSALDDGDTLVDRDELRSLLKSGDVLVLDVRPELEFEHDHLEGARSLPLDRLDEAIDELPRDRPIVAYCRGEFCLFADEAVSRLREQGFDARRIDGGWLELLLDEAKSNA
jgi:rhodanese-related sulfurtransferase/DNA-binding HxlR family transcriptional regulator